MQRLKNIDLSSWHTFASPASADEMVILDHVDEIFEVKNDDVIIGKGSNVIIAESVEKRLLHLNFKGMAIIEEDQQQVLIEVAAGEIWDDFVSYCCRHDYYGVENLAAIPGTVGAAPVQNIGAYGVECAEVIDACKIYDCLTQEIFTLKSDQMQFGYRNSIFKKAENRHWIILSVVFVLQKQKRLHLSYGPLKDLEDRLSTANEVYQAVTDIRWSKLPNPSTIPNAGSFFHNPIIMIEQLHHLQKQFPEIPFFALDENKVKIPAAWLIEEAGLKGCREGKVGIYDQHALIIINDGGTGNEIIAFANRITHIVNRQFNVRLNREPVVIGEIDGA